MDSFYNLTVCVINQCHCTSKKRNIKAVNACDLRTLKIDLHYYHFTRYYFKINTISDAVKLPRYKTLRF